MSSQFIGFVCTMFSVNLARNEFMFNQRFVKLLFHFERLLSKSPSTSTKRIPTAAADSSVYVRYQFPKISEIDDSIGTRRERFDSSFTVVPDIISPDEESRLVGEIEKSLKRLRYQHDHWDDVNLNINIFIILTFFNILQLL